MEEFKRILTRTGNALQFQFHIQVQLFTMYVRSYIILHAQYHFE